eukprot:12535428-Alexandrium_andersonii.AAC.1
MHASMARLVVLSSCITVGVPAVCPACSCAVPHGYCVRKDALSVSMGTLVRARMVQLLCAQGSPRGGARAQLLLGHSGAPGLGR